MMTDCQDKMQALAKTSDRAFRSDSGHFLAFRGTQVYPEHPEAPQGLQNANPGVFQSARPVRKAFRGDKCTSNGAKQGEFSPPS